MTQIEAEQHLQFPFSDAFRTNGRALLGPQGPRLPTSPLRVVSRDECRRGRLRSQKSAPVIGLVLSNSNEPLH